MSGDYERPKLHTSLPGRVADLATLALEEIGRRGAPGTESRGEDAVRRVLDSVFTASAFDAAELEGTLLGLRLKPGEIMDIVIPAAARALGRMWEEDEAGFLEVSLACARLQELCRRCGHDWNCDPMQQDCTAVLVAVPEGEDHILGAIVLADQLRRRKLSVHIQFQATAGSILERLRHGPYDCLFFSASTQASFGRLRDLLRALRAELGSCPIIAVGGQILNSDEARLLKTDRLTDYLSQDVEEVLSAVERESKPIPIMVAQ